MQGSLNHIGLSGEGLNLKDIHYTHNDSDEGLKWVLDAEEVKFSGDKNSIFFQDFLLKLELRDSQWLKLKGKQGNYFRASGDINLLGNLEGFSGNGYKIETEHILINEKTGLLSTKKPVKIFGPFFSVAGKGLFADLEKKKLKILSDVTTIFNKGF